MNPLREMIVGFHALRMSKRASFLGQTHAQRQQEEQKREMSRKQRNRRKVARKTNKGNQWN